MNKIDVKDSLRFQEEITWNRDWSLIECIAASLLLKDRL